MLQSVASGARPLLIIGSTVFLSAGLLSGTALGASATPQVSAQIDSAAWVAAWGTEAAKVPRAARAATKRTGVIRGKVRNPSGKPLRRIWVHAFRKNVTPNPGSEAAAVKTNARGVYKFAGLPKGKYRILANGFAKLREARWYGGQPQWQNAQKIKVRGKRVVKGVGLKLNRLPAQPPAASVPTRRPAEPAHLEALAVDAIQPYSGQMECRPDAQTGTLAVRDLIFATYGSSISAGLNRACQQDTSEHYDGRAIDWMVNSRDLDQGSKGDAFVNWLTETRNGEPGAMARRLGVMYIIWRGRSWGQYRMDEGWREYQNCQRKPYRAAAHDNICHRNHIHISMNPAGAQKQTSWWTGIPLPAPVPVLPL